MFSEISNLISANQLAFGAIFAVGAGLWLIYQAKHNFWFRDFWVTLPLIGDVARYSKNHEKAREGWMAAEEKLCSVYKRFVNLTSEPVFNERIEYMRNAGDLGRTPMPMSIKALLFVLVIAEGLGFSYLLGTWMAREGSANVHTMLMFAIVFVIGSILVWVTHAAGHQYYRTSLLRSCYKRYREKEGKEYSSRLVSLNDPQDVDQAQPDYVRCINRVAKNAHEKGSFGWLWVAGLFIAAIFVLSTYMRYQNMNHELTIEARQQQEQSTQLANDPFAGMTLPDEVTQPQREADRKLDQEILDSTKGEGLAANIMLGLIFVVTQIVGFGAGYKYGFVGRETYKPANGNNFSFFWSQMDGAYVDTGGFSTYDSYWSTFEPLIDIINSRLRALQQLLQAGMHENIQLSHHTFYDYLESQKARSTAARRNLGADVPPPSRSNPPTDIQAPSLAELIEKAKREIEAILDREAQIAYFQGLSAEIQNELIPWLKHRKAEAEAAAKRAQEAQVSELF